jgi:hypothetical protein
MFGFSYPGQTYPAGFPFVLSGGPFLGDLGVTTVHPLGQLRHVDAVGLRREAVAQGTRVADAVGGRRQAVALGARTVEIA